jgi:hypothetical protein
MNKQRISEILEAYRPGEGLEADPEVRQALELAARDPELSALRREIEQFDQVFSEKLRSVEVPDSLYTDILERARTRQAAPDKSAKILFANWFHPMAFAAAAAIILLLALSFTFWNPPGPPDVVRAQTAGFSNPVMETAKVLYANLSPSFRSREQGEIVNYLKTRGGTVPQSMPGGIGWDQTFACDVINVDGKTVSLVCFSKPGQSDKFHLFTFNRRDFEEIMIPSSPQITNDGKACCATWTDGELIHVLYSDSGEKNLRQLLDI